MAKDLKEQIEIMTHYLNGGEIEFKLQDDDRNKWTLNPGPSWNWQEVDYRIKKPKVTIEKWLIKDVDSGEHFIIELSDVDLALKDFPIWRKLKLLETYEVEL